MDRRVGCRRIIMFWVVLHKLRLAEEGLNWDAAKYPIDHDWYHDDEVFRNFGGPIEVCNFCRETRYMG